MKSIEIVESVIPARHAFGRKEGAWSVIIIEYDLPANLNKQLPFNFNIALNIHQKYD